jgi:hypothetical protein
MSLPTGSFMIYGKKNFINPWRLEIGFGLLFLLDSKNLVDREPERKIKEIEGGST